MAGLGGAEKWFWTFIDQCRAENKAELRLFCESGRLKVNMWADLGPIQTEDGNRINSEICKSRGLKKATPCQRRRRERRAADRAAAAEKAAEEEIAKDILEVKTVAEQVEVVKPSAGDAELATEKLAAETSVKHAVEKVVDGITAAEEVAEVASSGEVDASTSSRGSQLPSREAQLCRNCGLEMTVDHQCSEIPASITSGQSDLPVCLYCCHQGGGDHPVHFVMRCLCDDGKCSCSCYCTEEQVITKRRYYTDREWEVAKLTSKERAVAHAKARYFHLKYYGDLPCTDQRCLK